MSEQIIRRFHPLTEHPNKFIGMTDARYGDYVRYSDHLASRESDKAEIKRLSEKSPCGHPATFLVRSAETGNPLYCEFCDHKCGRADAEKMEIRNLVRAQVAEARIAELEAALSDLKVKPPGLESYSDQSVDANKKVDADHVSDAGKMVDAEDEAVRRDVQLVESILRDVCECEPDDADHPETICVLRGTLMLILDRNLGIDRAAITAAKEGK